MNILLVTMEMQVGGAETHVFELAKELADNLGYIYVQACNHGVKELY